MASLSRETEPKAGFFGGQKAEMVCCRVGFVGTPKLGLRMGFPLMSLMALWVFLLCRTPCLTARLLVLSSGSSALMSDRADFLHR